MVISGQNADHGLSETVKNVNETALVWPTPSSIGDRVFLAEENGDEKMQTAIVIDRKVDENFALKFEESMHEKELRKVVELTSGIYSNTIPI